MSRPARILIVEDKPHEREALAGLLREQHYEVVDASDPKHAFAYVDNSIDLVISELLMENTSGVDLLRFWKVRRPQTPFIMVTAQDKVESGVEALKQGAADYVNKPVNPDELLLSIEKCLDVMRKDAAIAELQQRLDERLGFEKIVGSSKSMLDALEDARRAAAVDTPILISGESGTGKELLASAIHQNSPRKAGPFVTVNMAALAEHMVESELFGHVKGTVPGALERRTGRFEAADGGTLFIDEISDLKLATQAKLLHALETRTIIPVGGNEEIGIDVRLVAATCRDLEQLTRAGQFRDDLYYRLNVIHLKLVPLRDRREDIPLLIDAFLNELANKFGREKPTLNRDLKIHLETNPWPGNVRQLRNCLECMLVLSRGGELTMDDLPAAIENGNVVADHVVIPPGLKLQQLERQAVEQALEKHDGNRTHAADSLGISVRTLQRKLKAWRLNSMSRE